MEKMTYAVKFLNELVESRKLKAWCDKNNLPHPSVYKIAVGAAVPTYAIICQMLPYIPVTDWFYFEGEEIPFERKVLEVWNADEISSFVRQHKHDYMDMASEYGITESLARNLFVNHRARPPVTLIRDAALKGTDPAEFFTCTNQNDDGKFYPERGQIVSIFGKTMLVLSKKKYNLEKHLFVGVPYNEGECDVSGLETVTYARSNPELLGKCEEDILDEVLKTVRSIFR